MTITGNTLLVGIVADPIAHVRTPQMLNAALSSLGIDAVCVPIHVPSENLAAVMAGARYVRNLRGIIVTIPHKEKVLESCADLTPVARLVGAANVVRLDPSRGWIGTNFDGKGFIAGLTARGHSCRNKEVLLLGAGGAGKAIAHAIACEMPRTLAIHNRTAARAEDLVAKLRGMVPGVAVKVAGEDLRGFEVIVNATSVGLKDDDPLPIDPGALVPGTLVCEAVMRDGGTPLLAVAGRLGCTVHHGQHMLAGQIAEMAEFLGLCGEQELGTLRRSIQDLVG